MLLLRLQVGFNKYCCFLCLWNNWATVLKDWPMTDEYIAGKSSGTSFFVAYKAGPSESYVKALDKTCDGLNYLKQNFPKLMQNSKMVSLLVHRLEDFCASVLNSI
jgi:hypothetical protein